MTTRRKFLQLSALGSAALLTSGHWQKLFADGFPHSPALKKFIQPLPRFGADIPVAGAVTTAEADYYSIVLGEYAQQLHPDLPKPTKLWGYADSHAADPVFRHLGGAIVAAKDRPVRVHFTNTLPSTHPLPVDTSLPGAEGAVNRACTHLHGGHVPWPSDGGPQAWFAPNGMRGPSAVPWLGAPGDPGAYDVWYPNDQTSRLMWYHDHAMGITRLNAYAGLATAYILRDDFELSLIHGGAIPENEIPLVIQDKMFKRFSDQWGEPGDLWYPSVYDPEIWDVEGGEPPENSCVPEFFGDTMLMNGVVYPHVDVEPRRYRLRILNACNARFCRLQLFYAQSNDFPGSAEPALNKPGPAMLQIGNECGFLPEPVMLQSNLLAPAERADVILDLTEVPSGAKLILYNDAAGPYPMGDDSNDYFAGNKRGDVITAPGYGPNTRTLLQFRVQPRVGPKDPHPAPLRLPSIAPLTDVATVRDLTLNEDFDQYGRLIQRLGTNELMDGAFARDYMDEPTETPRAGSTEIWRIFNLTGDTHPIHVHLTNAQVMGRRKFKVASYDSTPHFTGPMRAPDENELGWKETVRMNPGDMTQLVLRFDPPSGPPGVVVPQSPTTGGHEYVWHCHILEHEEHDMMRPLIVKE